MSLLKKSGLMRFFISFLFVVSSISLGEECIKRAEEISKVDEASLRTIFLHIERHDKLTSFEENDLIEAIHSASYSLTFDVHAQLYVIETKIRSGEPLDSDDVMVLSEALLAVSTPTH